VEARLALLGEIGATFGPRQLFGIPASGWPLFLGHLAVQLVDGQVLVALAHHRVSGSVPVNVWPA
jgi:hypothetical protein